MLKALLEFATSKKSGIPSIIRDKTGKISFRRSASMVVLTAMVIPDFAIHGLTYLNAGLALACLLVPAIPYFMDSNKNNQSPL